MRDNVSKLGQVLAGIPVANLPAFTANWTGQTIDLQQLPEYNAATLYILAGAWTDGNHTFTIQEAPDNGSGAPGTWTTVATTDLNAFTAPSATVLYPPTKLGNAQPSVISSAATAINQRVGYVGNYPAGGPTRFLRVIGTVTGATTGAKYMALWVLGEPRIFPAAV